MQKKPVAYLTFRQKIVRYILRLFYLEIGIEVDKSEKRPSINLFCEFGDKQLETEFFLQDMSRSKKYLGPLIFIMGILNTLFLIPDYLLMGEGVPLFTVGGTRAAFLILTICLYFLIVNSKKPRRMASWITVGETAGFLSFVIVFWEYSDPDFLIQVLGLIVIILITFLLPNRWMYMALASLTGSACFFIASAVKYAGDLEARIFSAGIVYTIIVIALIGYFSFRMNYYNRIQFYINKRLEKMSSTDTLTGLMNKSKLYEELQMWMAYSKRYKTPLTLVLFDIDDFKQINDQFGHLAGDKVVAEIADIVGEMVRETDKLARWGGDEFVILLPHTSRQQALEIMERIRKSVSEREFKIGGRISCSFGVASLTGRIENMDQFIGAADEALYKAKNSGKNVVMY